MHDPASRIIVALDFPSAGEALALARRLDPTSCRLKIGKELFTLGGPQLVERLQSCGFQIFLDLKFHDIPHTVARACTAAAELGVWMINVHALGGRAMLAAAREAVHHSPQPPLLVAVTLLTSLADEDLRELGLQGTVLDNVARLAALARDCGLDGVVCSPREAGVIKASCGSGFLCVTPGIRPANAAHQDQKRTATPRQAIDNGADYLVVGRSITAASDPMAALHALQQELSADIAG